MLKLWHVEIQDPEPGWGLHAAILVLSNCEPMRDQIMECVDWRTLLRMSPLEDSGIRVTISEATPAQAASLVPDPNVFACLLTFSDEYNDLDR